MQILNSSFEDIDAIFGLYDDAISFQKTKFNKHWQGFERSLIETEISENRQWKIVIDDKIACIFAVTFEDELIWGEKSNEPAIYIHRIVTNPSFRGNNFVVHIINWAKVFCKKNGKQFVRMDTWGDNEALIQHYVRCGFHFLGLTTLQRSEGLPKHYEGACLSLFEIKID
ncbi:GNAT family N-acetyltransferase [Emticicia sp. SJ17W-69]|uniref:GNAT family N-acetyltransferase n=1 Tax=Emticicia sp. SJ17W-69 TaxID=3421657 RepID=UPI003EBC9170